MYYSHDARMRERSSRSYSIPNIWYVDKTLQISEANQWVKYFARSIFRVSFYFFNVNAFLQLWNLMLIKLRILDGSLFFLSVLTSFYSLARFATGWLIVRVVATRDVRFSERKVKVFQSRILCLRNIGSERFCLCLWYSNQSKHFMYVFSRNNWGSSSFVS